MATNSVNTPLTGTLDALLSPCGEQAVPDISDLLLDPQRAYQALLLLRVFGRLEALNQQADAEKILRAGLHVPDKAFTTAASDVRQTLTRYVRNVLDDCCAEKPAAALPSFLAAALPRLALPLTDEASAVLLGQAARTVCHSTQSVEGKGIFGAASLATFKNDGTWRADYKLLDADRAIATLPSTEPKPSH